MSKSDMDEVVAAHVTEQPWEPEEREDGVYLVAAGDRTPVLKLCRPDRGSDLLIAGYVAALQAHHLRQAGEVARTQEKFDEMIKAIGEVRK